MNLNTSNIRSGLTKIKFNDNNFEMDYNNTILRIIPNEDLNYYIKINVNSASSSRTSWSFGASGTYVTLDYSDLNYTYKQSGYINSSQNCNVNKFTLNYNSDKLTIDICKLNSKSGTLIIDENVVSTNNIDLNITISSEQNIDNAYYNIDLNYILGNTRYIGYLPVN